MCEQCLGARTVRCGFKPGESEDETHELFLEEGACHDAAVVNGGNEHVGRHHIRFTAVPDDTLQFLDGVHLFGGFEQFDDGAGHLGQRGRRRVSQMRLVIGAYQGSWTR